MEAIKKYYSALKALEINNDKYPFNLDSNIDKTLNEINLVYVKNYE